MKKEKAVYRFYRYNGKVLRARREIPYEFQLTARLILDEICFKWRKQNIDKEINQSIDTDDQERFKYLSEKYRQFIGK